MGKAPSKRLLAALIVLPVLFCTACAIAILTNCTHEVRTSHYGTLQFHGGSGEFSRITSIQPAGCELFVEIPEEGWFPIVAIPQTVLDRRFKKTVVKSYAFYDLWVHTSNLSLTFKDGQLDAFSISGFSLKRTEKGDSFSLPIGYRELHAVWGDPDMTDSRWVRTNVFK